MRLNFNVLWIDDQPQYIQSSQDNLKRHVMAEGFRLCIIDAKSYESALPRLSDTIMLDDIDMVLVDYDLGRAGTGDAAIRQIRSRARFKDIIFYSSNSAQSQMTALGAGAAEGIFYSNRDTLAETAKGVFDALVHKVLDLDHVRGIVMGATSDIDHVVHDCLQLIHPHLKPADVAELGGEIAGLLKKSQDSMQILVDRLAVPESWIALLADRKTLTADMKHRVLAKALSRHPSPGVQSMVTKTKEYRDQDRVLTRRNELAHVRIRVAGATRQLTAQGEAEIKLEDLRELRRKLINYNDHFTKLLGDLGGSEEG